MPNGPDKTDGDGSTAIDFPAGIPRPHAVRDWAHALEGAATEADLIDISLKRLPEGKFESIWPESSLKPFPKPRPNYSLLRSTAQKRDDACVCYFS